LEKGNRQKEEKDEPWVTVRRGRRKNFRDEEAEDLS